MDGSLQPSMFIESQSSLDLMLGMQKNPSWDCGRPNFSRTLETEVSERNELNSKAPHHKRNRKASWGGGFEDKEMLSKSDSAKDGFVNGERIGYSPMSEDVCNLQIQYMAKAKILLEDLRIQSSNLTEFELGTNRLLPPKRLNMNQDKRIIKNRDQQCGQKTGHKAKGPDFDSSLPNSRLKKRLKTFEACEFENSHCKEFSETFQQVKVPESSVDLLMPNYGRAEEGSFTLKLPMNFLPETTFANQTSNGDVPSAPPSSKENTRCKKDFATTHVKKNLRVRALRVDWKEPEDSFLAGTLEKHNRRTEMFQHDVREDRCSFNTTEQTKSASIPAKEELVSQRAIHAEKLRSKNCHGKASSNGTRPTSSTREDSASGYPKSTKSEKAKTPSTYRASKYDAENGSASSALENFASGCLKSIKSEKVEISRIPSASTNEAANGWASSIWDNTRGDLKSTKFEKAEISQIPSALTDKAGNGWASSFWEKTRGDPKSAKSGKAGISKIPSVSTDEAGNGSGSSTWENTRGNPKSKAAKSPLIYGASTDEAETRSNKKDPKDGQTGCKKGLQAPPLNRGENGTSDEDDEQSHMNLDDGPVMEDCDLGMEDFDLGMEDCALGKEGNARVRTQRLLQLFHKIHKQFKGGHKEVDVRNIIVAIYPQYLVQGSDSIYGDVPGVEAGDEFKYRVEMDLVGLHHQFRRGIDVIPASKSTWCFPDNPKPVSVAACIVVAGGYVDNRDEGDIIIYTGEGGNNHFHDKGPSKDQTLTFGNKALRHSRMLNLCVRVIRKVDIKPPKKPYYRYDGLYEVVDMKKQRSGGHRKSKSKTVPFKPLVYKFLLVRQSAREKYKNVDVDKLWSYKPPSRAEALSSD